MALSSVFHQFFDHCIGSWSTERTYHYLTQNEVERSHTDFQVSPITDEIKARVLADNAYGEVEDLATLPGFRLAFDTVSEKGEKVSQTLNLLFVTNIETGNILEGDYLRDRAYEEARPIISHFRFDTHTSELLMTTNYTRVVSVDSITLINPSTRIRRILNYLRPPAGQPLEKLGLVGFGVEQKVA
ncbi:chorismate-binding protein [Leptolyngbya sp. Heron Island J]|uniref:phycobiliprotein lyase n=1 Tax=Leptolyngbya sp. Heron Island J TaxID=1385935 RepID=UPI0003B9E452|nr:phycobiliprotein lyase [Leptolyngbya sp. Heron Island J]ESA35507.1 chorismate-binding protein [Leptolyngbya sp. Heron Island J]